MKIEITRPIIGQIANAIALEATSIMQVKVRELEDAALIAEIRVMPVEAHEKVLKYLSETALHLHSVRSSLIASSLNIPPLAMKRIRNELKDQQKVRLSSENNIVFVTLIRRR